MSLTERKRLHDHWVNKTREMAQTNRIEELERLRQRYDDAIREYNEGKAAVRTNSPAERYFRLIQIQARCELLRNVDIIGCTTTGQLAKHLVGYRARIDD